MYTRLDHFCIFTESAFHTGRCNMCIHRECQINTHRTSHHWHVSCATERFHSDVNYVILDDSCIINTLTRLPMNDHHSAAFPACLNPWSGARSKSCPLPKSREVSHPCVTRVTWDFARSDIKTTRVERSRVRNYWGMLGRTRFGLSTEARWPRKQGIRCVVSID